MDLQRRHPVVDIADGFFQVVCPVIQPVQEQRTVYIFCVLVTVQGVDDFLFCIFANPFREEVIQELFPFLVADEQADE